MRKNYAIKHLIHIDPAEAKKQVLALLRKEGMHMANTAARIGCTHGTLLQWIKALDMRASIDALKEKAIKEGWYHDSIGGRPGGEKSRCTLCGRKGHNRDNRDFHPAEARRLRRERAARGKKKGSRPRKSAAAA